jgi:hypothetical protein
MSELRVPGAAPGMLPVGGNGWPFFFFESGGLAICRGLG